MTFPPPSPQILPQQQTLEIFSPAIPLFLGRSALEPVRLSGEEGVNRLFDYVLLLQTIEGDNLRAVGVDDWDPAVFLRQPIRCDIQLDGVAGGVRQISALVTEAAYWRTNGRQLQYRLVLRPWLFLATLCGDCRVFHDMTVVEVLEEVLAFYPHHVDTSRLTGDYPPRDYRTQYNETDFAFFSRLTQQNGINYVFEHRDGDHTLVLYDAVDTMPACDGPAYREVAYHAPGLRPDAEYFHSFTSGAAVVGSHYLTGDYDYARSGLDLQQAAGDGPADDATLPLREWHPSVGAGRFTQPAASGATVAPNDPRSDGAALAEMRLQSLRSAAGRARASGNLRGMVPGRRFTLTGHPRREANTEYLVLDTRFLIENPGRDSQTPQNSGHSRAADVSQGLLASAPRPGHAQRWQVTVDLVAHPVAHPLRPAITQPRPEAPAVQTAEVVGPAGASVHTDRWGRVQVRLPWYRHHPQDHRRNGGAERARPLASCWVRVMAPWAGNRTATLHVPRIGQEVLISFVNGDIDQPVCLGEVANDRNPPPLLPPGNLGLSGVVSRELGPDGAGNAAHGRSNHLLFDDTRGEMQVQLRSAHQDSSLVLGANRHIDYQAGRREARGQGFELRTDGHGVLRAGAGMLVSTQARPGAREHAKSMIETTTRLAAANGLHARLGHAAYEAGAQHAGDQGEVTRQLDLQNDEVRGAERAPPSAAARSAGDCPELSRPHLVVASAAGIACTSAADTHVASGGHTALSSAWHTSLAAGKSLLASARESIRLFAFKAGMKLVAAEGDIDIEALKNTIALLAKLDIRLQGDRVFIDATREVLINGGGSYLRLNADGITGGTAGVWKMRAAQHGGTTEHSLPVAEGAFASLSLAESPSAHTGPDLSL